MTDKADRLLTKEEADVAMGYKQTTLEWTDCRRSLAKDQHAHSIRQAVERVEGIENPHQRSIEEEGMPEDKWGAVVARSNVSIWNEAIQAAIKAVKEE